jgi:ribosome-associated protein
MGSRHRRYPRPETSENAAVEPVDGTYVTPRGLRIAAGAIEWSATRSGGPGGQHANTSDTAVTVTIDVASSGLPAEVLGRVIARTGSVITASSSASRSQHRNRALAMRTVLERLDQAAAPPPPPRRRSRPTRAAVEQRLQSKRRRSVVKRDRAAPRPEE